MVFCVEEKEKAEEEEEFEGANVKGPGTNENGVAVGSVDEGEGAETLGGTKEKEAPASG